MSEWKEYKISELVSLNIIAKPLDGNHGGIHPTTKDYVSSGIPFVMASDINNGNLDLTKCKFLTLEHSSKLKKGFAKEGDVLLTHKASIGRTAIVPKLNVEYIVLTPQVTYYRVLDKTKLNSQYLMYYFNSIEFQNLLATWSGSGSTRAYIGITEQLNLSIKFPSIKLQKLIAEILSSIDDKIELNNKINQELESLAQTLFKQWFIDFEFPNENGERYKSSGGEMVDSELGEIPKGWRIYSMDELLETVSKTYPLKKVKEVVFLNTGDIQDGKFLHKNFSNPLNLPGQAKKSIAQNDILYSEIRPANKRFAYVYFDASQYVVSTKLMVMRSKVEINSLFQYFYLTQQESIKYLQQLAESRSGTFPQITFSEVSTIKIALPDFDLVNTFVEIALKPYYDNQFQIKEENESLVALRDTLLPKLISGELEINEINN